MRPKREDYPGIQPSAAIIPKARGNEPERMKCPVCGSRFMGVEAFDLHQADGEGFAGLRQSGQGIWWRDTDWMWG